MRTWRKLVASLLTVMMLTTMIPGSVMGSAVDENPVPVADTELAPEAPDTGDIVPDPEPAPEEPVKEYSNDMDISPDGMVKDDILSKLDKRGYLYLSTSGKEFTVYADPAREKEACKVVKDGSSVLLVDGYENDMLHVRFADQAGGGRNGYIGMGTFTLLTDEEAADIAKSFGLTAVISEGVELYATEIAVVESEAPASENADIADEAKKEEAPADDVVITPDEEVIVPAAEEKPAEDTPKADEKPVEDAPGGNNPVQEDKQEEVKPAEEADIQPAEIPEEKQDDHRGGGFVWRTAPYEILPRILGGVHTDFRSPRTRVCSHY